MLKIENPPHSNVEEAPSKQMFFEGTTCSVVTPEGDLDKLECVKSAREKDLINQMLSSRGKIEELEAKRSMVLSASSQNKQLIEKLKCKIKGVLPAVVDTDLEALEEEHKALLSDKAGEAEYYQSLQNRVNEIKSISDTIKCQCGFEYKVQFIEEAKNCS
ncbi:uncharacterized protein [Typha latifolia]|uniref:uncharacterized protein isoform X1 n=1 Tax=Typha latifolia TaxID=4733 RepID=UPI003C2C1956